MISIRYLFFLTLPANRKAPDELIFCRSPALRSLVWLRRSCSSSRINKNEMGAIRCFHSFSDERGFHILREHSHSNPAISLLIKLEYSESSPLLFAGDSFRQSTKGPAWCGFRK